MKKLQMLATLAAAATLFTLAPIGQAVAQVAGATTTVGVAVTESTQLAMGWSVKKTLMGKTVYNETGAKVGKVEDLIISPERNVSYLIIGAGGFVGIGRHDVAVLASQIQNQQGKLVMAGATKDSIKALPAFDYTNDSAKRDAFIAGAEAQLAKARENVAALQKKASAASAETKVQIGQQADALAADVKVAETKLGEMKSATAKRWKEFESSVSAALKRMSARLDKAAA